MVKKIVLRTWSTMLNEYIERELPLDVIDEGDCVHFPILRGGVLDNIDNIDNPKPVDWLDIYK